jgi:hypothetical protein
VSEAGGLSEFVIPHEQFADLDPDALATFHAPTLPFEIRIGTVFPHSTVMTAGARRTELLPQNLRLADYFDRHDPAAVNGFFLRRLPPTTTAEQHNLGCYVQLVERGGGPTHTGILHGYPGGPFSVIVGGRKWDLRLQHKRWPVPFEIHLDDFRKEDYARENKPKAFESDVTQSVGGQQLHHTISMNQPLRDQGYTFFQSGWGPQKAPPNTPLFSTFSVVENPADQLPLVSCFVIMGGLLVHFIPKLYSHVRKSQARRAS